LNFQYFSGTPSHRRSEDYGKARCKMMNALREKAAGNKRERAIGESSLADENGECEPNTSSYFIVVH
jgi:hypothetical protein